MLKYKKISQKLKLTICLIGCITIYSSCRNEDKNVDKKVFHFNIHAGFTSMDPAFARNQANIWVCNQIFNGLVSLNDDLKPVPCIAKSWEIDSTGTIYTFHLKNNVHFQDHELFTGGKGRKVTAKDFVYSLNRIIDPKVASPGAWIFNDKILIHKEDGETKGSFYALNDSTFQIKLIRPFPPFLGILAMQYCSVVPHEIVNHYKKDFRKNPVGTGPFQLKIYVENERLILNKNPHYFKEENGQPLPFLDAVDIRFIPNKQNEFLAFLRGDLDFLSGIDGSFKDILLTRNGKMKEKFHGKFVMEKIPYLNTEYLGILMENQKVAPLKNKYIRQAINYGFDRNKMLKFLRNDIGVAATNGFVPKGVPSFDTAAIHGYDYNPGKARELIKKSGYPNKESIPVITLLTNPTYLDLTTYIAKSLQEIGLPVKTEVVNPSLLREWMAQSKASFFRASWIADYPDAENYLALFYSSNFAPNGPNYTHFSNSRYDSLYETAIKITNDSARFSVYHKMENLIMEEAPIVVLYYDEVVRLKQNNVIGLGKNAINLLNLEKVNLNRN